MVQFARYCASQFKHVSHESYCLTRPS